jgi:ceramide glucosyltransferase
VLVTVILSVLTLLSFGLLLWQFAAALRFPLHRRVTADAFAPSVTVLKPLKGFNEHTAECLCSWFAQKYRGPVQMLFGVAEESDPVCDIVQGLLKQFPHADAELILAPESLGANAKVSTLVQLARRAKHDLICVSDADVRVSEDFLANAVVPLRDPTVGLVNCFYELANPTTLAMRWEAIAVNADFWSQVLQSNTLKPQDFALGAAMITRRVRLKEIGGFESLLDYLADDYQLGHKIAATGARIELSPVVVQCLDKPMDFREVWKHQLRWERTIRASQPAPYFFSVLANAPLWSALLALLGNLGGFVLIPDVIYGPGFSLQVQNLLPTIYVPWVLLIFAAVLLVRVLTAASLQRRLTRTRGALKYWWLVPAKDFLQCGIWAASFLGNMVEWRGRRFRVTRGGRLAPL